MRIFLFLGFLFLSACSKELEPDVLELVYATPYPPSHPFSRADQVWMDFVEQRSNGTLRIAPNWSGALLSSEHSMIELRHGLADIGLITPIYVKGGAHLIRMQSGFYSGITEIPEQISLYKCLSDKSDQFDEEMAGLKILAIQGGSLPGIISASKRIESLDDIRGMRLRVPTELLEVLDQLGADPVNMPMGDVYSSLAKGVLDGVVAPMDTFSSLHFSEVAEYYYDLVIPRGAYPARAMGEARWNSLSEEHKQVLEAGIPVWQEALAAQIINGMVEGEDVARAEGIVFSEVSPEAQQRFDTLYLESARGNAEALQRYDIDGLAVFENARASINSDGSVTCSGVSN